MCPCAERDDPLTVEERCRRDRVVCGRWCRGGSCSSPGLGPGAPRAGVECHRGALLPLPTVSTGPGPASARIRGLVPLLPPPRAPGRGSPSSRSVASGWCWRPPAAHPPLPAGAASTGPPPLPGGGRLGHQATDPSPGSSCPCPARVAGQLGGVRSGRILKLQLKIRELEANSTRRNGPGPRAGAALGADVRPAEPGTAAAGSAGHRRVLLGLAGGRGGQGTRVQILVLQILPADLGELSSRSLVCEGVTLLPAPW